MMQSTQFSLFALLGGFALYPFFVNQSRQQRQNACFVLGAVLLAIATTSSELNRSGLTTNVLVAVSYALSYVFYAAALLKSDETDNAFQRIKLLVFIIGAFASIGIAFTHQLHLTVVFSVLQLACLIYFALQTNPKSQFALLRNIVFLTLYFFATVAIHTNFNSAAASEIASTVSNFTLGSLLVFTTLHLIVQEITLARIKNQWETKPKIDNDALKLMYKSKRVIKDFQHDLRQPLSTVGILASVGRAISKDPEVTARYQHIQTAQRALKGLMDSFFEQLNYTLKYPVESDALPMTEFRIDEIISPLVEEYRLLAAHKNIQIRYAPTNAIVISNKNALTKIIRNGLDNALKYTTSGGMVIGTRRRAKGVCIQIADTGSGIENDKVAKHDKGWGHGSQIIQELSEQIFATTHCKNRYYNNQLAGSRFEVFLPTEKTAIAPESHRQSINHQFNARVLCKDEQELAEVKQHIPTECFDQVQFSTQANSSWEYAKSIRNCNASVYIRFAKTTETKQKAIEEMRRLSALLDRKPCCIVVYDASLKKNSHIEFMDDYICIPIHTHIQGSGANSIKELFPTREARSQQPEQHTASVLDKGRPKPSNLPLTTTP